MSNIQLTSFVSRLSGYPYRYRHHWDFNDIGRHQLLTPSYSWSQLRHSRSITVDLLGLGDIRINPTQEGLRLLNVVSSGSAQWAQSLDSSQDEAARTMMRIGRGKGLSAFELGKKLHDFTQSILVGEDNMDQLSVGGFPVIVTKEVYDHISDALDEYGAVHIGNLTGSIIQMPSSIPYAYSARTPKCCLYIGSPKHIKGISSPEALVCSAWTIILDRSEDSPDKYLQWMFKVGVRDWKSQLENAVDIIDLVRNKVNGVALFEFDEERNWFDPYTPFTPRTMRDLFSQFQQGKFTGLQISPVVQSSMPRREGDSHAKQ